MKRRTSDDASDALVKKPRKDALPEIPDRLFNTSRQRKATALRAGEIDEDGFIQGSVVMKWPLIDGHLRIQFEVAEDGSAKRFEVTFGGTCPSYFASIGLQFDIKDVLQLSLRGVTLEEIPCPKSIYLPIHLVYKQGVLLRFLAKHNPPSVGMLVDYWDVRSDKRLEMKSRVEREDIVPADDWFATPAVLASTTAAETRTANDHIQLASSWVPPPTVVPPTRPPPVLPEVRVQVEGSSEVSPVANNNNVGQLYPSKKAMKKARREETRARRDAKIADTTPEQIKQLEVVPSRSGSSHRATPAKEETPGVARTIKTPQRGSAAPTESASSVPARSSSSAEVKQSLELRVAASMSPSPSSPPSSLDPALELQAGCVTENGVVYSSIGNLVPSRVYNIIGVVISLSSLTKTKSDEFSRKLILVDPSNVDTEDPTRGFSVTFFTKQRKDNLPDAEAGHIFMLRGVAINDWRGAYNGACPSFKIWSWTLYDPKSGKTKNGHSGTAPSSVVGSFAESTPSHPGAAEMQYCIRLGDWWVAVLQKFEQRWSGPNVVQIGGGSVSPSSVAFGRNATRVHRLIKDASPSAPPTGFFDCTVEILHKHRTSETVCSVYVTDYTSNEGLSAIDASWCSPALGNMVLRMEMWYDAARYAEEQMQKGDFYLLPNARMKMDASGYMEATISEVRKFEKLDVDELENWPHLRDLLNRKVQWQQDAEASGAHEFPHRLIEEAEEQCHFCCTIQLLAISNKSDRTYIYVTDYTSRSDLAPVHIDPQIMCLLRGEKIVKIVLFDDQIKAVEGLEPGDFLAIKNLRLRPANGTGRGYLVGKLGGEERLIFKLQPKLSGNTDLRELLRRKREFEDEQKAKQTAATSAKSKGRKKNESSVKQPTERPVAASRPPSATTNGKDRPQRPLPIKRVLEQERCPCRFRVVARVTDFWPMKLEECVGMFCTNCKEGIPENYTICTKCDGDMMETYVRPTYRFFFQIQDEVDDLMQISVTGECAMLKDLEAVDLRDDPGALEEFKERVSPVIGDLADNHEAIVEGSFEEWKSPWLDLIIGSWEREETGEKEYVLLDHTVLEDG